MISKRSEAAWRSPSKPTTAPLSLDPVRANGVRTLHLTSEMLKAALAAKQEIPTIAQARAAITLLTASHPTLMEWLRAVARKSNAGRKPR